MSTTRQIEQLFQNPSLEIQRLETDLTTEFGTELAFYIKKIANEMTSEYHDDCAEVLLGRFTEVNERLDRLPKKPSKEQYDEIIQEILYLVDPAKISKEIQLVINNIDVYEHYQSFLKLLEKDIYYELYQKYAFTREATIKFNQFAFVHIQSVMEQLKGYTESLRQHNILVKDIQALKVGASVLGMGVTTGTMIPFVGAGLRKLVSIGGEGQTRDSLDNIFSHIDSLDDALREVVRKLGDSIYLLFLTLVGGTFISVNKALYSVNGYIQEMTSENVIVYALLDDEARRFEQWYNTSIDGITKLAQQKRWQEAIIVMKRMHEQVANQPIHARHCIRPNQAALYLTHVHYYAVYQEALLAEYQAGHIDSFLVNGEKFLNTLILYPLAKDLPSFSSPPSQFIFLYIKQYMKKNNGHLSWMEDAKKYIGNRHDSTYLLNGEYGTSPADYIRNIKAFYVAERFYITHEKIDSTDKKEIKLAKQYSLLITEEDINKLIEVDVSINHPDALTTFLSTFYNQRKKVKRILFIKWAAWRLGIVAAVFMVMFAYSSKEFIGEKWTDIFSKDETETTIVIPENVEVRITESMVNIRISPSLHATVIATGYANETYVYLNEEQLDDDGVTWLTIQLSDGQTGYVSKKVVMIQ